MVELGLEPLHFLEVIDEDGAGCVALEIRYGLRGAIQALGFQKAVQLLHGILQLFDDDWRLLYQPDFPRLLSGFLAGEEGDGGIHGLLLLAKVEDFSVGLGAVEHAICAGEGLDQAVVLEILVDIERVQVFGIETSEQHVHH